jgi:hypothetical protein
MHAMKKTIAITISSVCVLILLVGQSQAVKVKSKSYNELFESMFIP